MARGETPKRDGMTVHLIDSPQAQAELASRGLTSRSLARAIARVQLAEGVRVGTPIGVNDHGFFGSTRDGWRSDQPDAFDEALLSIPGVQIFELLGRVPAGTTGEYLEGSGNHH